MFPRQNVNQNAKMNFVKLFLKSGRHQCLSLLYRDLFDEYSAFESNFNFVFKKEVRVFLVWLFSSTLPSSLLLPQKQLQRQRATAQGASKIWPTLCKIAKNSRKSDYFLVCRANLEINWQNPDDREKSLCLQPKSFSEKIGKVTVSQIQYSTSH